jgi:crotonobetainyl-CoA:carnitine CoA-transferase CaiB-like acyl-CoA transferase
MPPGVQQREDRDRPDRRDRSVFGGLRVVELAGGMAGPMAGMILADHGADVIKVEPPRGHRWPVPPASLMWHRGKRSVVLDLTVPGDRARVADLLGSADVVIESLGPRLGPDPGAARRANPGLVWCSIGGFGPAGAAADLPADLPADRADLGDLGDLPPDEAIVAAATGRMTGLDQLSGGHPGVRYERPAFTAAPVGSYGAAQLAVQGITAALLERRRTGRGQRVGTSLLQGAMAFVMRQELGRNDGGDGAAAEMMPPAVHRGIELCFLTAECADGRYIQMCARQDAHFRAWLGALGLDEVLADPVYARAPMGIERVEDVDALEARLRRAMRTRTQSEWMRVFTEECDVGADPFLTPAEFLDHPDMVANGRVVELDDPTVGRVRQLGPLVAVRGAPAVIGRPAPRRGQHTAEVLAELAHLPHGRGGDPEPAPAPAARPDGARSAGPLAGVTILEVAYYIAGPLAGAILAEMGARVVKVEPLDGDPYRRTGLQSVKFLHGKESITLDLKSDAGRAVLRELVKRSDVVVHSFRAGAAARLGLDPATVRSLNPRAVHLHAGSYGAHGPQAHRAAFHSTPNALTGGGTKQAGRGNPPVNDSYADPGSALGAATAIVLGLYARARTGAAPAMETTMLCSTGYIHSADMVAYEGAPARPIADAGQHGLAARYRLYRCADGWVFVAAPHDDHWEPLLDAVGLDGLRRDRRFATPEARRGHDDELADALATALAAQPAAHWVAGGRAAGVAIAPVHPEPFDRWLIASGLLRPAEHPAYPPYWRLPPKVAFSGAAPRLGAAAACGEHSRHLLRELGRSDAEIDALIAAGVTGEARAPVPGGRR